MTSNNLEAIELLKTCVERLQEQGFSSHGNTVSELNEAIDLLLQADEVQEERCINAGKQECSHGKPIKETKLRDRDVERFIADWLNSDHEDYAKYVKGIKLFKQFLEEEY